MKNILYLLLVLFLAGCENDDICADEMITPRLIIRVHDKTAPRRTKTVNNLLVMGKDRYQIIQPVATTDSIVLPLKLLSGETSFLLAKDAVIDSTGVLVSGSLNELKITATPSQEFLSKGCGYRVTYNTLAATSSSVDGYTSWIDRVHVLFRKLDNEKKASIHIFY